MTSAQPLESPARPDPGHPSADLRSRFGLTAMPFTRELQPSRMWRLPELDRTLDDLEAIVSERMSAIVIAPAGTGKTALIRRLADRLPDTRYQLAEIKVTSVGRRDFYRGLARAIGLEPVGSWPRLLELIQGHCRSLAATEALRLVLIIDEAQDLRPEVLSTVRMLTNFEMDSELLLSVLLVGDAGLESLLAKPELTALRSRFARVARLRLLSRDETAAYVNFRLDIAGARSVLFDDLALSAVHDLSRGNMRAIDHLCRTALGLAAAAGLETVDAGLVTQARRLLP